MKMKNQPINSTSTSSDEREDIHETTTPGTTELSMILEQMAAYFTDRANVDDLDVLSFSLHHLFCHVDYLYRAALPELLHNTTAPVTEQTHTDELAYRQSTWSKLRTIKHSINRLEPLCNLLSDATRCILDALDLTGHIAGTNPAITGEITLPRLAAMAQSEELDWLQSLNQEHWQQALATLTGCLSYWQQSYSQLAHFANHFAHVLPAIPSLTQLDEVFNTLLDSTCTIFGDILPGFQAISAGRVVDDAADATLLFDLMQQTDQLLLQFDTALEPLHALIEHFALMFHR